MKRHLLLLCTLAAALAAGAHPMKTTPRASARQLAKTPVADTRHAAPRRAAQMHLGVVGDDDNLFALGIGAGSFRTCALFLPDQFAKYAGAKVVGCRFAVGDETLKDLRVWLSQDPSDATLSDLCSATPATLVAGWNEISFPTPYTLTGEEEELYLGYDFTAASDDQRSALLGSTKSDLGFLLCEGGRWYDYSNYGTLAVQLLVEGDNLPDYDVALSEFSTDSHYYAAGTEKLQFYVAIRNNGTKTLNDLVLNIAIDGRDDLGGQLTIGEEIAGSTSLMQELPLADYRLQPGRHTISIEATGLADGTQMSEGTRDNDRAETFFYVYQNASTRQKSLLEVYVNQNSYYDPTQTAAIETLLATRPDVVPVFIHGDYYGTEITPDEMAVPEALAYAEAFGLYSTPSIAFNRVVLPGATDMLQEISMQTIQAGYLNEVLNYINEVNPSFATVGINGRRDPSGSNLLLTVTGTRGGDFAGIFGSGALTVYITEDGIVADQADGDEVNASYVHNHVLRRVVSGPEGDELEWNGLRASRTYSVDLDPAWDIEKLHVVAFIAKPITETSTLDDVDITNTAIADVSSFEISNGIQAADADGQSAAPTYDLAGRRVHQSTGLPAGIYVRAGHKVVVP